MIKAYAISNYFLLEIPGKIEPLQDGKSAVRVTLLDDATKTYRIESPLLGDHEIALADLVDQGGTAYDLATWQNFYYANSSFSSAPSSNGALKVVGFWDADTNTPDLSSLLLSSGDAYQVSVPGSTNLNGQSNWATLDLAVYNDSLIGKWFKIDNTDDVISVNGKTGAVTVTKTDVGLDQVDNTSDANKPVSGPQQTALNGKENEITAGTASQYYRGDKTFQTLDKNAVGLNQVDNTSDANKPVSNATQSALDAKLSTVATSGPISGDGKPASPVKLDWRAPIITMGDLNASAGVQVFDAPAGGFAYTTPENESFRINLPLAGCGVEYDGSIVDVFIEYNLFSAANPTDNVRFSVDSMMGRPGVNNYSGPGVVGANVTFPVGAVPANSQTRQKIGEFVGNANDSHVQLTINRKNLPPAQDFGGDFDIYSVILKKQ